MKTFMRNWSFIAIILLSGIVGFVAGTSEYGYNIPTAEIISSEEISYDTIAQEELSCPCLCDTCIVGLEQEECALHCEECPIYRDHMNSTDGCSNYY